MPVIIALQRLPALGQLDTGRKLLLTLALGAAAALLSALLGRVLRPSTGEPTRGKFLARQLSRVLVLVAVVAALVVIWFRDPGRLATFAGLLSAGVAIALQRVITAFAGFLLILRGKHFRVGDRITIGGVRGDVVALDFIQTTVMEMGQAPGEQGDDPSVWIGARQYTGRLVRVTNDRVFDSPLYNYSAEFPFFWDELRIPVKYGTDYRRAESIILDAVRARVRDTIAAAEQHRSRLQDRYAIPGEIDLEPAGFVRMTDSWIELAVRFIVPVHGVRAIKDAIARDVIDRFAAERIEVASGTYEIVGLPEIRVRSERPA